MATGMIKRGSGSAYTRLIRRDRARAIAQSDAPDGQPKRPRDPEVVAAVQQALMKHPHFHANSATAFGFANTAIDAYIVAISRPDRKYK